MKFYGNGIVRLDGGNSVRFSKPEKRYEKGFAEVENQSICDRLMALGYEHDKVKAPKKPTAKKTVKKD